MVIAMMCVLFLVIACEKSKNSFELEKDIRESYRVLKSMEEKTNK